MIKKSNLFKFLLKGLSIFFAFSLTLYGLVTIPSPTTDKYLNDYVGIIEPSYAKDILSLGHELESKTGAQVSIVIINSTEGIPIQDYALKLFRTWGIGSKEQDNGLLILLALQDKNWRVEVGRGLEGAIPDLLSNHIMDTVAKPYFVEGHYGQGLFEAYNIFSDTIAKEYQVTLTHTSNTISYTPPSTKPGRNNIGLFFLVILALDLFFNKGRILSTLLQLLFWANLSGRGPRGGSGGGMGGGSFGGGSSNGGGSSGSW